MDAREGTEDGGGWDDGLLAASLLRRARLRAGMTLENLAAISGIETATLAAWEAADTQPPVVVLTRVLRAAGMELLVRLEPLGRHDAEAIRQLHNARIQA
jgi:transcriptional regulator with XRE-family HTH domain